MAKKQPQVAVENIEAVSATEAFIDKYQKHILYGVIAIIVITAAWIGYVQLIRNPKIQKANEALFQCENYFANDNYDKALNGDGQGCVGFLKVAAPYMKERERGGRELFDDYHGYYPYYYFFGNIRATVKRDEAHLETSKSGVN